MRKAAIAILTAALLASTAPLAAFTLVEKGPSFEIQVKFSQTALGDGSVRLAGPDIFQVKITSLGENKVQAAFTDSKGRKAGEAHGIIAVLRQGAAAGPGAANAEQKVQPGQAEQKVQPGQAAMTLNFGKLGFDYASTINFRPEGQKLTLEITSHDGSHAILIGLLLPAVQRVREAAAPPAK